MDYLTLEGLISELRELKRKHPELADRPIMFRTEKPDERVEYFQVRHVIGNGTHTAVTTR